LEQAAGWTASIQCIWSIWFGGAYNWINSEWVNLIENIFQTDGGQGALLKL